MTVALYARRKSWPLEAVTVRLRHSKIHAADCADCETKEGMLDHIESDLEFDVVKHSFFGFAIGAVGCVNLTVAQPNRDCFERPALASRIQRNRHRSSSAQGSK